MNNTRANQTFFVTGATGYIGSQLVTRLVKDGATVHALVRNTSAHSQLRHPRIKIFPGDVRNLESVRKAIKGCGGVFHLAAFARLWSRRPAQFYEINVQGTRNVLVAALENEGSTLVYTSSTAVFGHSINCPLCESDPRTIGYNNDYDLSKCMAEELVLDFGKQGLDTRIVNPSRVYGPGPDRFSNPFTRLIERAVTGRRIMLPGCASVIANYAFVQDVVEGHLLAMDSGAAGERYILGGENVSYRELFDYVRKAIPGVRMVLMPRASLKITAALHLVRSAMFGTEPPFTPSSIERLYANTAFSCQKAIQQLNYRITPFEHGLLTSIQSIKRAYANK
jgi:nucleoside-diphosphate-sugar epimerase